MNQVRVKGSGRFQFAWVYNARVNSLSQDFTVFRGRRDATWSFSELAHSAMMAYEEVTMATDVPSLQGLRHLALRVRDLHKAKDFYLKFFSMKVVWEPDAKNCYLSSGTDNLALHEVPEDTQASRGADALDHFGFMRNPSAVDVWAHGRHETASYYVAPKKIGTGAIRASCGPRWKHHSGPVRASSAASVNGLEEESYIRRSR